MKKILLGTSALIGAAVLLAGAANAEDPKVTVGGFSTFEAGWSKSDNTGSQHQVAFRNDNEIHFNIAGKTDAGLGYGAEIDLQADIDGSSATAQGSTNSGINARRTYGYLQGDQWGHIEYGSNDSAARNLKVDASNIARATGGIDGDWYLFADVNGGGTATTFGGGKFITVPRLPIEAGPAVGFASDVYGNDTKITYYTPRFSGFQLGVSYAPELSNRGQATNRSFATDTASNVWSGGLNYENQFDQLGVAAAVTGESAKSDAAATGKSVEAWNAGLKLSYMGFSAAGSYGDWRDSFAASGTKADYWTGGIAYETGPVGASVTYLGSETKPTGFNNKFQDVSVGVDYKLAPGLTPFVEYTWYDLNPTGTGTTGTENKGNVVIVGSQLSF
ncbi:MAG TPA: porin [Rickettsiales bacterium]|nr:porin [Rickettsiales bacterium]